MPVVLEQASEKTQDALSGVPLGVVDELGHAPGVAEVKDRVIPIQLLHIGTFAIELLAAHRVMHDDLCLVFLVAISTANAAMAAADVRHDDLQS